ncbi:hypothetical protein ADK74_21765 [Streptomyces decoyicus]|nr:hypothetical protein ADK74_21765 [Streptomyces decoyicus]
MHHWHSRPTSKITIYSWSTSCHWDTLHRLPLTEPHRAEHLDHRRAHESVLRPTPGTRPSAGRRYLDLDAFRIAVDKIKTEAQRKAHAEPEK